MLESSVLEMLVTVSSSTAVCAWIGAVTMVTMIGAASNHARSFMARVWQVGACSFVTDARVVGEMANILTKRLLHVTIVS